MTDLISKKAAIKAILDLTVQGERDAVRERAKEDPVEWIGGIEDALSIIEELPTIDPVKHGKIIESEETNSGGLIRMVCSECGKVIYCTYGYRLADVRFCPYCGARMDL